MVWSRWFGVAALVCSLGPVVPAVGQQPTPAPAAGPPFKDVVEVVVVNIDVYVRDRQGKPVAGLTREDFRVLQDGVAKPISNFAALTEEEVQRSFAPTPATLPPGPTPAPAATPAVEIRPIYVVLYVDNENLDPLDRNRVLRRLREFVTANLRPPVQMMVASFEKSLKVAQPFTDDPTAVNAALRGLEFHTGGWTEREAARRDLLARMAEEEDRRKQGESKGQDQGEERTMYGEVLSLAEEEANNLAFSLGALREAVTMLAGVQGRKSVIYISNGLPMTPGLGVMHEYATLFRSNSILSQRGRFERQRDFTSLTGAANAQDVSLYTVDAQGLEVAVGGSAEDKYAPDPLTSSIGASNYQDSLRFLAENTGGLAVVNTNDVVGGFEKIRTDLFTYYSLGYTIGPSGQDRVHRVEVQLPGHPECSLRYRERFVEKSLESRVQDLVMTALVLDIGANPIGLRLSVGEPAPAAGARWTVPVRIAIPVARLALIPQGEELVGRVMLFAAARDDAGKQSDIQRQEYEVRVPASDGANLGERRYAVDLPFLMEEGSYRVAVGMVDQVTNQLSFERIQLKVP
jgi:VWFA-related protein